MPKGRVLKLARLWKNCSLIRDRLRQWNRCKVGRFWHPGSEDPSSNPFNGRPTQWRGFWYVKVLPLSTPSPRAYVTITNLVRLQSHSRQKCHYNSSVLNDECRAFIKMTFDQINIPVNFLIYAQNFYFWMLWRHSVNVRSEFCFFPPFKIKNTNFTTNLK